MTFYSKICLLFASVFSLLNFQGYLSAQDVNSGKAKPEENQPEEAQAESVASSVELVGYELAFPAMGTLIQLTTFSSDQNTVEREFQVVKELTHEIEQILTDYDPNSETRRLTDAAYLKEVTVSEPLWQVLVASDRWYKLSGGKFDCSLGTVTSLWRKYRRAASSHGSDHVPSKDELASALAKAGWHHVTLNHQTRSIRHDCEGLRFDFGAIGKGYVVDQIFESLVQNGLPMSLVNMSGNIRCGAAPPGREHWNILLESLDAEPADKLATSNQLKIANRALATSGDLTQFMMIDGQRRSHVLDPSTGVGVLGPMSATVIAATAMDADAAATVACVLGAQQAIQLLSEIPDTRIWMQTLLPNEQIEISKSKNWE